MKVTLLHDFFLSWGSHHSTPSHFRVSLVLLMGLDDLPRLLRILNRNHSWVFKREANAYYKFPCGCPSGFQRSERDRDASFSQLSPLPLVLQYTSMSPTWSLSFNSFLFLIDQFYELQAIHCSKCLRERHILTQQIYHNIPFLLAPIAIPQTWIQVLICTAHCWYCCICCTCVTPPFL